MRITVDVNAAQDPAEHGWLDRLLHRIEDGWHIWDVTGLENFHETTWVTMRGIAGMKVMEVFRAAVRRSAWAGTLHERRIHVTLNPVTEDDLRPQEGAQLADERMIVLVENRNSDGAFIERVVHELDRALGRWWNQQGGTTNLGPVRFDSLGGKGEMAAEVRQKGHIIPRPRLIVVIDSDRATSTALPSAEAQRVERLCGQAGFPCWVLAKREAENYLPRELLEARPDVGSEHNQRLEAWNRLSDDQKDHYDMKDGLGSAPTAAEVEFFKGLNELDRQILSTGFGANLSDCWGIWKVQAATAMLVRGRGDLEHGLALLRMEV